MSIPQPAEAARTNALRLWPGAAAVALQWLLRFGLPRVLPEAMPYAMGAGLLGGLAVLLWWAFFSRAPRLDRWGAMALFPLALAAATPILDKSIATGMMGMMYFLYAVPTVSLGLVAGAAAGRNLAAGPRRAVLAASILAGAGCWALLRTGGIDGTGRAQFALRWSATPEERLLARGGALPPPPPPAAEPVPAPVKPPDPRPVSPAPEVPPAPPAARTEPPAPAEWPGFRGPDRDGVVRGVRIGANWAESPPVELWRRPVGPGWSSFAVRGSLLYTQEQRGDFEGVSCYRMTTGEPVWLHRDPVRFWESNGGAGPRSTPTISGNAVYAFGATGLLNALDAATGAVLWKRDVAADTKVKTPEWGFSSSPLVVDGAVIVAASRKLAAYELASGRPLWTVDAGGGSYSSPHLVRTGSEAQVVMLSSAGAIGVAPPNGHVLWKHAYGGANILQPAAIAGGGILITSNDPMGGTGTRRLAVAQGPSGWTVEERWTSNGLKPYFNDFVVHNGHAYGFDGAILCSIDLEDGRRKWKGGRYGHGQMILLPDQDLLLALSEEGELALVSATPEKFSEIARFKAMDDKTWNHPALVGGVLLVRNGQEMVAFRLPPHQAR